MLTTLRKWLSRKRKVERSSHDGDDLTAWEQDQIRRTGRCPDCGGELRQGPHGGMAINHLCLKCSSEFSLTFIGEAVIGERISDPGPRDVGERAWAYGL